MPAVASMGSYDGGSEPRNPPCRQRSKILRKFDGRAVGSDRSELPILPGEADYIVKINRVTIRMIVIRFKVKE